MKRFLLSLTVLLASLSMQAKDGWPANYEGVMLQGFFWDSYNESKWIVLESQADELSQYFQLVWIPQSGNCKGTSMGYDDYWWFPGNNNNTSYNSSFGTETELRSMISTFKTKGIGTIADVVINHRKNRSNWVDFPTETYNGVTYKLQSTDICKYDDKYYDEETKKWVYPTLDWATANNYELSSNRDTGEDWSGMRDLDHKSENVQTNVKAYLKMLLNDLGYIGFRYDMVKGYGAEYTKIYNEDSQPTYSVGECWDSSNTIKNWIDGTGKTSAAFDFQFKYVVRNAVDSKDWSLLDQGNGDNNYPLVSNKYNSGSYRQYAVTFVENHDTQVRKDGSSNGPLKADTLAANAYLMAMPGTPCVFLAHWIDCKLYIKPMIEARQLASLKNTSSYEVLKSEKNCFAVKTDDKLIAVIGNSSLYTPSTDFVKVLDGYHYAYYLRKNVANRAWVSHESGHYEGEQQVVLAAITSQDARMVYTLDGTNPTASSPSVASGEKVTIPVGTTTLKAAMLINNAISGSIITRTYEVEAVEPFDPYTIDIYVNTDQVNWTKCNFHSFGGDGSRPATAWPGTNVTEKQTINGKEWYHNQYSINSKNDFVQFVFSTGTGSPQTVDSDPIKQSTFFEVLNEKVDGKNKLKTTTTGIQNVQSSKLKAQGKFFTLDGRYAGDDYTTLPRGIYINNGRKIIK